jgi:hypothetical protein
MKQILYLKRTENSVEDPTKNQLLHRRYVLAME